MKRNMQISKKDTVIDRLIEIKMNRQIYSKINVLIDCIAIHISFKFYMLNARKKKRQHKQFCYRYSMFNLENSAYNMSSEYPLSLIHPLSWKMPIKVGWAGGVIPPLGKGQERIQYSKLRPCTLLQKIRILDCIWYNEVYCDGDIVQVTGSKNY